MAITLSKFHTVDLRERGFAFIEVIYIGDAHAGHTKFNKKEFLKAIEWAKGAENRFIILMGDLIECLTKTHSPSGAAPSKHPIDKQIELMVDWLLPVKDKILFSVDGNHEERTIKSAGFRALKEPFRLMGIEHREYQGAIRIMLDKKTYRGYLHHGTGSSLKPAFSLRKIIYGAGKLNMDFVAVGHIHKEHRETFPSEKYIGNRVVKHECLGIRTGGFLNHPEYAQKAMYPPPDIMAPILRFYNNTKDKIFYFPSVAAYNSVLGL